jgi:hypothetical protein
VFLTYALSGTCHGRGIHQSEGVFISMLDLFGSPIEQPKEKTFKENYLDYISSSQWERIRNAKIEEVGGICERCGVSKYSERLEVHHLHYKTFKHESLSDLQVLCHKCHEFAEIERQTTSDLEKKARQQSSSLYIGFVKWLENGNEYIGCIGSNKIQQAREKFLTMLYKYQKRAYSLDLRVFGYQDDYPNWKPGE